MRPNLLAAAIAVPLSLLAAQIAHAGEGMWVPQQLPEIAGPLKKAGLKLSPQQLSDLTGNPMGAVVALGGCTASFVSPNGLVVTNHHCAYGAIQLNSTAENNLIKNGFNAPATTDEVSAGPNARVFVLDEITDVTKDAKAAIATAGDDALARTKALEAFENGQGVCQDHSHVMLACLRAHGIPARYVSGYFFNPNVEQHDSHAWVEVFDKDRGQWLGVDATHKALVRGNHCRLAVGKDFTGASPVRGIRTGGGQESLEVSVTIQRVD